MLHCAVKFCGGCNPCYDRGAAYVQIREALADIAVFQTVQDNAHYDLLLIIRGCTGCPYLYEDICATNRIILCAADEIPAAIDQITHIHNRGA